MNRWCLGMFEVQPQVVRQEDAQTLLATGRLNLNGVRKSVHLCRLAMLQWDLCSVQREQPSLSTSRVYASDLSAPLIKIAPFAIDKEARCLLDSYGLFRPAL
jgi:hypothetical protein